MTVLTAAAPLEFVNADRVYRKVTIRLLPFLFICYVVNYIDRANIGYAKLQFTQDLGFSDAVYGLGAGLFYISYLLFEVPSNLYLQKIGARATLTRIMIIWGIASGMTCLVTTPMQLYVARFVLGAAEAGFFPGVVLYLSYWFPAARRGRISSILLMAVATAGLLGGLVSGWIMHEADGLLGLRGWQALFIIEAIPAVLLGLTVYWVLDDSPQKAKWLSPAEKEMIRQDLENDQAAKAHTGHSGLFSALRDTRVYLLALVYCAVCAGSGVISIWGPSIIKSAGVTDLKQVGFLMMLPFATATIVMYLVGLNSDRMLERRWHVVVPSLAAAVAFFVLSLPDLGATVTVVMLCLATAGVYSASSIFWAIPPTYLGKNTAATGIAFISSVGAGVAGFGAAALLGWIKTETGSLSAGLFTVGVLIILGCWLLIACMPGHLLGIKRA
ncbi:MULTISPECIES: MFS transporter [Pseudomonas]|jgi:ACS family phthalate transporter-like MFS transporter|uniref:MFS transporter n=1 Tax=Pseudomonas TaxID=286 RepID=UPI002855764B|nr:MULTISPECIES: MFS transporter [Pseudomonas]MDR6927794.1 ACS family phthalate transporter-like MFS transporter [Pseudomonas sp. BE134]MDR7283521.1 ACS family phthalate transporter-like MFS transporter [Pseudomonas corrugata]